jgi:hypothetical protein
MLRALPAPLPTDAPAVIVMADPTLFETAPLPPRICKAPALPLIGVEHWIVMPPPAPDVEPPGPSFMVVSPPVEVVAPWPAASVRAPPVVVEPLASVATAPKDPTSDSPPAVRTIPPPPPVVALTLAITMVEFVTVCAPARAPV